MYEYTSNPEIVINIYKYAGMILLSYLLGMLFGYLLSKFDLKTGRYLGWKKPPREVIYICGNLYNIVKSGSKEEVEVINSYVSLLELLASRAKNNEDFVKYDRLILKRNNALKSLEEIKNVKRNS